MNVTLRPAPERGHADHGWLDTWHSFSFAGYHDPQHMGFRALRVLNDDTVAPGAGFPTHGHRDMEIVTYVVEGQLEHRDSLGTGSVLRPGDVQAMTAGTGVTHSEFNASREDRLRFLQIWILPDRQGLPPGYQERHFPVPERRGRLRLVAAPGGEDGALRLHQDVRVYAGILDPGVEVTLERDRQRHAWIQVATGQVDLEGHTLRVGDGAAVSATDSLRLRGAAEASELLVFDLA